VAKRNCDLLGEIEQAALDESVPVATALRKCLALGGHAGSAELREWASRELHGYLGHEKELPDYRRIRSPLLMDGIGRPKMLIEPQVGATPYGRSAWSEAEAPGFEPGRASRPNRISSALPLVRKPLR
jgi:hypothetical protein